MPPDPLPPRRTPLFAPAPPRRRFNKLAVWLAIGLALIFVPLTYQYQNQRTRQFHHREEEPPAPPRTIEETGDGSVRAEDRQWHMQGIDGITETQARTRFGKPLFSRDYNVSYGAFLGPQFGLKHYFLNDSPGFENHLKGAAVVWKFPEYSAIREMIFRMRESYLTLWLIEPRVEVNIQNDTADAVFPRTGPGEWVVIDNYRVGEDLAKAPPVTTGQAATPAASP